MRKFNVETEDDYRDYLYGRILRAADEKGRFKEAFAWLTSYHRTSEMEEYLERLL
jgi:hypothetical protein